MYYKLLYYIRRVANMNGPEAFKHAYHNSESINLNKNPLVNGLND